MHSDTVRQFAELAAKKTRYAEENPFGFMVGAMMAGAYVGIGIILIMTIGDVMPAQYAKVAMGLSFGIALTLVVFAGSELFTGYTMYMTLGKLAGTVTGSALSKTWIATWFGNFLGAVLLVFIFHLSGAGHFMGDGGSILHKVAHAKVSADALPLFMRAILCNWLVCLAIWTSSKTQNDAAKLILIFWCLFAFITSGFEHSIANMTVLSLSFIGSAGTAISLGDIGYNLAWVTAGNIVGGAVFMGMAYWRTSPLAKEKEAVTQS